MSDGEHARGVVEDRKPDARAGKRCPPHLTGHIIEKRTAMLATLWMDEAGLTTVEYALLLGLVVAAAAAAWTMLGSGVNGMASPAASSVPDS